MNSWYRAFDGRIIRVLNDEQWRQYGLTSEGSREANREYASFNNYFWLPCPRCGRMFGGHECGTGYVPTPEIPEGRGGWMTCNRCSPPDGEVRWIGDGKPLPPMYSPIGRYDWKTGRDIHADGSPVTAEEMAPHLEAGPFGRGLEIVGVRIEEIEPGPAFSRN